MKSSSRKVRFAAVGGLLAFLIQNAWAVDPFPVKDIRVEGLQRVEAGTVFASIPVRVGDTYTDEKAAASIRALFALGLFKDVRIESNNGVVVVIVEERPNVADVDFSGNREFDKDVLKRALRDIGLSDGRPFDKALVDRAEQELKRQYISKSMYAVEIVTTVTPIERNRVNVSFAVTEGEVAKISEISFVGNKSFSSSTLRGLFDSDTGNWLSWYTKSNRYTRTKLNADVETLRSYYLARGFLEFKVDSTQVAISPDKKDIAITLSMTEGEQFAVSNIKLAGNFLGKEAEFQSLVTIKAGEPYNATDVAQTTKGFTDYFANFGYAFARAEARTEIDRTTNRVEITLVGEPSRRVYVRRINVAGNDRTRDEVIRREFRQLEAAWYDGEKIRLSRNRVDRLGYFTNVGIETQEVAGAPDQVDLTISVVEKPTGSISLGAGISSADGLGLSFGFKQENAFGSGNSLGIEVNTSKSNRTVVLSTSDPYFTDDGVSRTFDLYQRTSRPYDDASTYAIETTGIGVRFGVPFSDSDTVFFGLGADKTRIIPGTLLPTVYQDYANEFGYSATAVPVTIGWSRDTRDSALVPSTGRVIRTNGEWSVGGDMRYVRGTAQYQQFVPVTRRVTAAFNSELSIGAATGSGSYPIFKNYYLGGLGSVRGFEQGSLTTAAQRAASLTSTGGAKKVVFNAELLSPLPGGGNDRTLRGFAFVDAGGIYAPNEAIQLSEMRSSFGVGISWISPVGPLRLAFARPLSKFDADKMQSIQFQIGTTF
ncbi:outer membrane protein assembly factor BamA [Rhodoferax sp. TBRC 17198]|uniref:outer membrane protein assembly factor BamA n=1 Tax=Rhodoferax potami TaxID=3068338 RepID=UPI0028BE3AD8|nr:outer membrane protein assembly factor BamA [Rhodoferax sp. TBRC 17198]MDT7522439.1 outer membrane protein assembly factor BamA [Rhodoferax sp. TBRC 17198]